MGGLDYLAYIHIVHTKFVIFLKTQALWKCNKIKAEIITDTGLWLIFCPKCPAPYSTLDAVENELIRMETGGVFFDLN